jgi:hypothetical protein
MTLGARNDARLTSSSILVMPGTAAPETILVGGPTHRSTSQHNPGDFVNYQSVTFVVWLGIALFALLGAALLLWRTRRTLARVRQDHSLTLLRLAPAPAPSPAPSASSIAS